MSLLIVLGMHRSGTSALTGVLTFLGFAVGKHTLPPDEYNSRGYFEDSRVNKHLDILLHDLHRSWDDERLLPANWLLSDAAATAADELANILIKDFDFKMPTVMKNPRFCRLLPLLQENLTLIGVKAQYVFSLRSPFAVMRSLAKRNGIPAQRAALLYVSYLLEAELNTRGHPRVFVDYEDLLRDWRKTINHIGQTLQLDIPDLNKQATLNSVQIDTFLSTELNHSQDNEPLSTGLAVDLAIKLYRQLRTKVDSTELDELRLRWHEYIESIEPWLSEATQLNRLLYDGATRHARSEIYWSNNEEGFCEGQKVLLNWEYGQESAHRFVFPVINTPLNSLRWDITNRPAICLINQVWVEDPQGHSIWKWKPGEELFSRSSPDIHDLGLNTTSNLKVMITGFDPQGHLIIPQVILMQIKEGYIFCANWQATIPMNELENLMQEFSALRSRVLQADIHMTSISAERDELQEQLHKNNDDLALLSRLHQQSSKEIDRAEAQLALLKDLWLDKGSQETL